jgi:hypothetical protein
MRSLLFGQFLLERNLINPLQLTEALEYQRKNNKVLGELAVEYKILDRNAVLQILECQLGQDKDFGKIAVENGFLTGKNLEMLLHLQQEKHVYLGEALIRLGAMRRDELERQLKEFDSIKQKPEEEKELSEEYFRDNPAAAFFNLATKLLPRMTGGMFIAGGFYPTISAPSFEYAYSQKVKGDINMEVVLHIPDVLLPVMGKSIADFEGWIRKAKGKARYERAVKSFIHSVMEIFAYKEKGAGKKIELEGKPRKVSREGFLKRHHSSVSKACAEFYLINPPDPKGEFLQFNICLIFN